jgi:hypothetical protein
MPLTADITLLDTKRSADTLIDCVCPQNIVISIHYYRRFAYTAHKYGRGAKDVPFCDTISLPLQAA